MIEYLSHNGYKSNVNKEFFQNYYYLVVNIKSVGREQFRVKIFRITKFTVIKNVSSLGNLKKNNKKIVLL